jgi:adenylate cyclase
MSSDGDNEFFCDGITEEIINALARIDRLKITSRTSSFMFKGSATSLSDIADQLHVNTILEGSVRLSGNKMRITAQLIDVAEDSHFWSETWDRSRDDLFEVQDEISLQIADRLREHVGHFDIDDHLVSPHTDDINAYEWYLKGRFHFSKWNPEDCNASIACHEKALAIDPQMIDALVGLADSYSFLAVAGFAPREDSWSKAVEALDKAKQIDPDHAGLNYLLANHAFFIRADFSTALEYTSKSIKSQPNYPEAHRMMCFLHGLKGDVKQATQHILYAKSVDPINPETLFFEANHYYRTGNTSLSKQMLDQLLEENPQNVPAIMVSCYIHLLENQLDQAESLIMGIPDQLIAPDEKLGLESLLEIKKGKKNSKRLEKLIEHAQDAVSHHAHSYLFLCYANLGDFKKAFQVLDHLFEHRSSVLLLGFSDPLGAAIFEEPAYRDFHSRIYAVNSTAPIVKKSKKTEVDQARSKQLAAQIADTMKKELPFLNPGLTLRLLADQLEIHPNQLSWLINDQFDKNFNEFVNSYRIGHFKQLAIDPANQHISLIGLAYESGFNSKTVFNTAFKKAEGITPSQYQKTFLNS